MSCCRLQVKPQIEVLTYSVSESWGGRGNFGSGRRIDQVQRRLPHSTFDVTWLELSQNNSWHNELYERVHRRTSDSRALVNAPRVGDPIKPIIRRQKRRHYLCLALRGPIRRPQDTPIHVPPASLHSLDNPCKSDEANRPITRPDKQFLETQVERPSLLMDNRSQRDTP